MCDTIGLCLSIVNIDNLFNMLNNFFTSITKLIINKSIFMYLGVVMRHLTIFSFLIFIFSSNVQANQLMDVANRADSLKASAG
jgi:hypothetical protein